MSRMGEGITIASLCGGRGLPAGIAEFEHAPVGEVLFGVGCVETLGERVAALGCRRPLLVTDAGIMKAGHAGRIREILERTGLEVTVYAEVRENPTTKDVHACVGAAKAGDIDGIIGLGGGSSMDTGKGCNFIFTNGGRMSDYKGIGLAKLPMLPFVAVPTTAGTGSECQSFALIADEETHMKMACGDKKAAAALAVLDPELTLTQPGPVTAHTGIDAITHAVETAVCSRRNAISGAYSRLAYSLLDEGLAEVLGNPGSVEGRAKMQLGAAYAGTAIENSMLGAAHACANPLTAKFGIVHGEAVGMMLPAVIRFNAEQAEIGAIYADLCPGGLAARIEELLMKWGMPTTLRERGVDEGAIPGLSLGASQQWTAQFNPRPVGVTEFIELFTAAL